MLTLMQKIEKPKDSLRPARTMYYYGINGDEVAQVTVMKSGWNRISVLGIGEENRFYENRLKTLEEALDCILKHVKGA